MANHDALRTQRPEINLYRVALGLIRDRLRWDLTGISRGNERRLRAWRNRYVDQKAVIMCNGPSLLQTDFSLLDGLFVFGLNKINLLMERQDVRPSCIVAVNKLVLTQNSEFYNTTGLPLFLDSAALALGIERRDNVAFLHSTNFRSFARNCEKSVYQGYTVTYVALQLAFHMGFKNVALIGCDHTFSAKGPANKAVQSSETDTDHFDPRYFAGGQQWQLPDLAESEISYMMARDVFEAFGRTIVNATCGGQLEVFPRQSLPEFVRGSSA